jgi:hypothetical protein
MFLGRPTPGHDLSTRRTDVAKVDGLGCDLHDHAVEGLVGEDEDLLLGCDRLERRSDL